MKKTLKTIPHFKSEQEEKQFWQNHDSTEYIDWDQAEHWQMPNLKLTTKPVTIRLSETLINRLKIKAHQQDIPYQTMIKQILTKIVA